MAVKCVAMARIERLRGGGMRSEWIEDVILRKILTGHFSPSTRDIPSFQIHLGLDISIVLTVPLLIAPSSPPFFRYSTIPLFPQSQR